MSTLWESKTLRYPLALALALAIAACSSEPPSSPLGPSKTTPSTKLAIDTIVVSSEPITDGNDLPEFKTHFPEETKTLYVYLQTAGTEALTGSYVVMMDWHVPNDFNPPLSRTYVDMRRDQRVAQFVIHNEAGMGSTPHLINVRAGRERANLTASGSYRVFTGMTDEEAVEYLRQEEEYRRQMEEKRRLAEEERKKREAAGTGGTVDGGMGGPP